MASSRWYSDCGAGRRVLPPIRVSSPLSPAEAPSIEIFFLMAGSPMREGFQHGLHIIGTKWTLNFLDNLPDAIARDLMDNNDGIKNFTESDIERITSGYTTLIGKGGFGEVYKGVLDNDDIVAVKRYIRADLAREFMEEISNGNLEDILHNRRTAMSLETRLGIAIGCAEALSYMHSMHLTTDSLVCHGDIKPANILLDENLTARLSDFGLSRLLLGGTTRHTMNVKGSIDYVDLVCLRTGCLTPRSDVYSFGIVLLELITRKRVKEAKISLVKTFSEAFENGKMQLMEIFDDELVSEGNLEVLETIGKLAILVTEQLVKLWAGLRRGQSLLKISLGIFKRNAVSSVIRIKLQNVKVFTAGELIRVTQNYSRLIDENFMFSYVVYKGSLQDNKLVAVVSLHKSEDPCKVKSDVYSFGVVLMELINSREPRHGTASHIVMDLRRAYMLDMMGAKWRWSTIWKLAALCTTEEVDERPTMEQLAKHLGVLRRFWKKRRAEDVGASTGYCTEVEAAAAVGISGDEATEP
uniref:Protein kinase domain-containing protein n=1 Tax=Oryza brachyantha TaxID=4533 RepID=J3N911_ORYBR